MAIEVLPWRAGGSIGARSSVGARRRTVRSRLKRIALKLAPTLAPLLELVLQRSANDVATVLPQFHRPFAQQCLERDIARRCLVALLSCNLLVKEQLLLTDVLLYLLALAIDETLCLAQDRVERVRSNDGAWFARVPDFVGNSLQ